MINDCTIIYYIFEKIVSSVKLQKSRIASVFINLERAICLQSVSTVACLPEVTLPPQFEQTHNLSWKMTPASQLLILKGFIVSGMTNGLPEWKCL